MFRHYYYAITLRDYAIMPMLCFHAAITPCHYYADADYITPLSFMPPLIFANIYATHYYAIDYLIFNIYAIV